MSSIFSFPCYWHYQYFHLILFLFFFNCPDTKFSFSLIVLHIEDTLLFSPIFGIKRFSSGENGFEIKEIKKTKSLATFLFYIVVTHIDYNDNAIFWRINLCKLNFSPMSKQATNCIVTFYKFSFTIRA